MGSRWLSDPVRAGLDHSPFPPKRERENRSELRKAQEASRTRFRFGGRWPRCFRIARVTGDHRTSTLHRAEKGAIAELATLSDTTTTHCPDRC